MRSKYPQLRIQNFQRGGGDLPRIERYMQLTGQKHWTGPIITLTCFTVKFKCLSTSIACFVPNSVKGKVKEPMYLNVYRIISVIVNEGMECDFLIIIF